MIFLHIDPTTSNTHLFDKYVQDGKQVFALIYMEGCGPCNATRPEWNKLQNILSKSVNDNVVVVDIDQDLLKDITTLESQPKGFPTMIYISDKGEKQEFYEDSSIKDKTRTIDSFVEWIESKKIDQIGGKKKNNKNKSKRKKPNSRKTKRGGKWSLKYKRSINCNRPKGFSQRQHCKYGRK